MEDEKDITEELEGSQLDDVIEESVIEKTNTLDAKVEKLEEVLDEEDELFEEEEDEETELPNSSLNNIPIPNVVEENVQLKTDGKPFNELSNYEKIKFASAQNGVEVLEPKKSCKHCHGTGVISTRQIKDPTYGLTSGNEGTSGLIEEIPNPCRCLFKKQDLPKMFTGKVRLTTKMEKLQYKRLRKIFVINSSKALDEKQRRLDKNKAKKKTRKKLRKKFNKR